MTTECTRRNKYDEFKYNYIRLMKLVGSNLTQIYEKNVYI